MGAANPSQFMQTLGICDGYTSDACFLGQSRGIIARHRFDDDDSLIADFF